MLDGLPAGRLLDVTMAPVRHASQCLYDFTATLAEGSAPRVEEVPFTWHRGDIRGVA